MSTKKIDIDDDFIDLVDSNSNEQQGDDNNQHSSNRNKSQISADAAVALLHDEERLRVLRVPQLRALLGVGARAGNKAALLAELSSLSGARAVAVGRRVARELGVCVRLCADHRSSIERAEQLFGVALGLDELDVRRVLALAHVRRLRFAAAPFVKPHIMAFPSRVALLGFEEAARLCSRVDAALALDVEGNADGAVAWAALYAATEKLATICDAAADPLVG